MGKSFKKWVWQAILFSLFTALVFMFLKWLNLQVGTAALWVSGVAMYWVLSGITILPWNVYFAADDTLFEILETERKGGKVVEQDKKFALLAKRNSLIVAVLIHIFTSIIFFILALFTDLGSICYLAAGAALSLTILRPSIRAVDHLVSRLNSIGNHAKYPRDDIYDLKERLQKLEFYDKTAEDLQKKFQERYEELRKEFDNKCIIIQNAYDKPTQRIREFENLLDHMQKELSDKIDSFDDAVAFKTAWERVVPEFAKIFRSSENPRS